MLRERYRKRRPTRFCRGGLRDTGGNRFLSIWCVLAQGSLVSRSRVVLWLSRESREVWHKVRVVGLTILCGACLFITIKQFQYLNAKIIDIL